MTTGLASVELSECRWVGPRSSSSALSLSSSTTARRTVQTLIGSYVALRTSTRPPIAVEGDDAGPCRWCAEHDTDPTGAGGTVLSMLPPESSGGALPVPPLPRASG